MRQRTWLPNSFLSITPIAAMTVTAALVSMACEKEVPIATQDGGRDGGMISGDGGGVDGGGVDGGVLLDCAGLSASDVTPGQACRGDFVCHGDCPCGSETIQCVAGSVVVDVSGDCTSTACIDGGMCSTSGGPCGPGTAGCCDPLRCITGRSGEQLCVPPSPGDCSGAIEALSAELYASPQACNVVVRLDYSTRMLLGYQVFCGPFASVTEETARTAALRDAMHEGVALNPPSPEDAYVFYQAPGDFGGMAAVSAGTGLTLFGGSIVWDGHGDITYPTSFRDPGLLGSDCPILRPAPSKRGYDLRSGTALPAVDVDAALAVVDATAAPGAFWDGGYLFDAVVILYPRTVGAFDPSTAEWVVILGGGWLE